MRLHAIVAVAVTGILASIGTGSAMPIGPAGHPSLIEKAQVVVQKTVTTVVRRRPPVVIVKRPTVVRKTVIVR